METLIPTTVATPPTTKPKGTATYTVADLAEMLGVSERHVHRLKQAKEIPGLIRLGGRIVFSKVVIDKWLADTK